MIERTFQDIPEGKRREADQQSFLVNLGWSAGTTWDNLLRSKRVLIVSEAGAGKTYECCCRARRLWASGEPAFFIELAALEKRGLRDLLDDEEEARLYAWLASQSDVATFFLDSIDELKLTLGSFEQALKQLKKGISSQLARARIVITTRPIPFDEQLIRRVLPVPTLLSSEPSGEAFAEIAMRGHRTRQIRSDDDDAAPDWRTVSLMPLSDTQIVEFGKGQGVEDAAALLEDLERRNAQEFVRRPQDLIELCADWRQHKRIRNHRDQVEANVHVKLQPRHDRPEAAELSVDKAIEGASRLALAMMVTRRMTIRHSAASDIVGDEAALDPAIILSEWNPNERKALLERPIFGFASYGRVRFHHRSVAEWLAAERLRALRNQGVPFSAVRRLLFAQTKGKTIVRPTKRPIAGWLALTVDGIFELLRDNEPEVLVNEGDPEALSQSQRNQVLRAYVERYGHDGWRGLNVPQIQVHRFASPELADEVSQLWETGIENPEVRQILLSLIRAGRLSGCADIAHVVAFDDQASTAERLIAVEAMLAIADPRIGDIASDLAVAGSLWPDNVARRVALRLFPRNLSIKQLCQTLSWMKEEKHGLGELSWHLPRLIANAELDPASLESLRDGLVELLSAGLLWREEWPHIVCDRPHLSGALAATCMRGLERSTSDAWLHASVLALRLHDREYSDNEAHEALRKRLTNLASAENECLFWAADSLGRSLHAIADPWMRLAEIILHEGPVQLRPDRDLDWIKEALGDTTHPTNDRAMLLEAAMNLPPTGQERRDHVSRLQPLVADQPSLVAVIDQRLKPPKHDEELRRREEMITEGEEQQERQYAEDKTSWIRFWSEVAGRPERAFSSEHGRNTAWNLWRAMSDDGEDSRSSGWNRRLIEEQFGKETADQLRLTLMSIWREDHPTLPSERPENQRGTYLQSWQLGLAALYAEAEDPSWATKLSEEEAKLAARYALIELNGLPFWMERLVDAHPGAVDSILGNELSWDLKREPSAHRHSTLLQHVSSALEPVATLFLPRLREWLNGDGGVTNDVGDLPGAADRLRQVIGTMLMHGDEDTRAYVLEVARARLEDDLPKELIFVWLPTLVRIDPELGVSALEDRIRTVEPGASSEAVKWFGVLFGDRYDGINLKTPEITPELLLRLLRLAYRHVRPVDDARHEDVRTLDIRDFAEDARNEIVNALLDAKGEKGWAAKLDMAKDPLFAHFKDRIIAVAVEHWAQEFDSDPFDERQAIALDKKGEAPASTNEAMFAIMKDRLADLDDLLLHDTSPREAWAGIAKEKVMRREIARELLYRANGLYTVDQEAVTGEEKETDIRLRSVVSDHEAVIELKMVDGRWSARDLRNTIYDQLVLKYMVGANCRAGCLLVALAKDPKWQHPDNGKRIGLPELMSLLCDETKRVEQVMGGVVALSVHLLDLRSPYPNESLGKKGNGVL